MIYFTILSVYFISICILIYIYIYKWRHSCKFMVAVVQFVGYFFLIQLPTSVKLFFQSDFCLPSDGQMLWQCIIVMPKYINTGMLCHLHIEVLIIYMHSEWWSMTFYWIVLQHLLIFLNQSKLTSYIIMLIEVTKEKLWLCNRHFSVGKLLHFYIRLLKTDQADSRTLTEMVNYMLKQRCTAHSVWWCVLLCLHACKGWNGSAQPSM
jgi:hypothetical protein